MDNWPLYHDERIPLSYEYFTSSGLYYQGYIEGQKGRSLSGTKVDDIPLEFVSGIEDGYADWLSSIKSKPTATRGPIEAGVTFKWSSEMDIYFEEGDIIYSYPENPSAYIWDPGNLIDKTDFPSAIRKNNSWRTPSPVDIGSQI